MNKYFHYFFFLDKYENIIFTTTGNNLYIAKQLGGELYSIPKLMGNDVFDIEDDVVGLFFQYFSQLLQNLFVNSSLRSTSRRITCF